MSEKHKILVIDDEPDLRENLKYVFEMKGYEVMLAEDGVKGLKALETYSPHLIILDLNMPNMGGVEFYQKICVRDMPTYPVFILTARANMEKFFKDFNVDGFMSKPFEIADLVKEVGYVISRKAAVSSGGPRKVFIVDSDEGLAGKLAIMLLNAGFTVDLSRSGAQAIERISKDVPDLVCANINLPDIEGEVVIQKLRRMVKTSGIKSILYTCQVGENERITEKIQAKPGIDKMLVISSELALMEGIRELLGQ